MSKDGINLVPCVREVSDERVADIMVGLFENGCYSGWLLKASYAVQPEGEYENPKYSDPKFWRNGGRMLLRIENPDDENEMTKEVGLSEIVSGLTVMARDYASHFNDFVDENDDAATADVFGQMLSYGKLIYG